MSRSNILIGTACIIAIGVVVVLSVHLHAPNRLILQNLSGVEITDVSVTVTEPGGTESQAARAESIASGQSISLWHGLNDSVVAISYRRSGQRFNHTDNYVDLWNGEAWCMKVLPDGSIQSGHQRARE